MNRRHSSVVALLRRCFGAKFDDCKRSIDLYTRFNFCQL